MNKAPRKRRRWFRRLIWLLVILLIIGAVGYFAYASLRQQYTVTYDSYTATTGSISNALSFSGNLQLIDSASYSSPASTSVRKVYVAAGDHVSEGDSLVRLANGTTIEADFDGWVNVLSVEEDDDVSAGDALVQIADFAHQRVSFRVDEYDIGSVAVGQACTVTATATEQSFESEIASIDYISASGGNVAYYTATCDVDVSEDVGVYPGMQVTVTIPKEEANNVVVLNMNALSFDERNSAFVYMKDEAGELIEVPVDVGVSNGNYVEIVSGLNDGDEVYVESQQEETGAGLLAGIFGRQQFNPNQGGRANFNGGDMPDFGGNMPDFGDNSGRPNWTGGGQP